MGSPSRSSPNRRLRPLVPNRYSNPRLPKRADDRRNRNIQAHRLSPPKGVMIQPFQGGVVLL